jgi:hypothetical protein
MDKPILELLEKNKAVKIKSLYKGELSFICTCGIHSKLTLQEIVKRGIVRCDRCYELHNKVHPDIYKDRPEMEKELAKFITKTIGDKYK